MPDKPHIPHQNSPEFIDARSDGDSGRFLVASHTTVQGGRFRDCHPAISMLVGSINTVAGIEHPTIQMDHAFGPTSLIFVPTVEELRVMAATLTKTADTMEAQARATLDAALRRAPGKGGDA